MRQIKEGRKKHDESRNRKIPGFDIGVRAEHKDYGKGVIIRESMFYFHRVDLKLDKPTLIAGTSCSVVNVWPGHMTILDTKIKKSKSKKK